METLAFWFIQIPGWLLFVYLVVAQCTAALSYEFGVKLGTQEPAEQITEIGAAFFGGFALADLVFYAPILGLGLVGQILDTDWGTLALAAALGTTVYWPIISLATVRAARGAPGWSLPKEAQYWVVLPLIAAWGLLGLIVLWASA
jgi:hypothetical protein